MSQQPWRRGSATPQPAPTRRTQSIWANPPSSNNTTSSPARTTQGINRDGFRMAKKDLGGRREQNEFNMLLSPSRGVAEDDPTSLKNPAIQERFRDHIAEKLRKWSKAHPFGTRSSDLKRRNEELGIILLDLRKLREGIHSIRRVDTFACEVYEASVLLSLLASNQAQLLSSLPHLVTVIHPALAKNDLTTSLSSPSVSSSAQASRQRPAQNTRSYYITLYLLHSHLLPAFTTSSTASSTSASSHPPLSSFLPTLLSLLTLSFLSHPATLRPPSPTAPPSSTENHPDPSVTFLLNLHLAFIHSSVSTISTLFSALPPPPAAITAQLRSLLDLSTKSPAPNPLALLLRDSIPQLRENCYRSTIEKAFRFPPDPSEWLSKWLLFEFEVRVEKDLGLFNEGENNKARPAVPSRSKAKSVDVVDSWEEDAEAIGLEGEDDVDLLIRKEAERRATEFVRLKKGLK